MHISFILLKKFKLVRTDDRTWQLGLNEREINQIIKGDAAHDSQAKKAAFKVNIQLNTSFLAIVPRTQVRANRTEPNQTIRFGIKAN